MGLQHLPHLRFAPPAQALAFPPRSVARSVGTSRLRRASGSGSPQGWTDRAKAAHERSQHWISCPSLPRHLHQMDLPRPRARAPAPARVPCAPAPPGPCAALSAGATDPARRRPPLRSRPPHPPRSFPVFPRRCLSARSRTCDPRPRVIPLAPPSQAPRLSRWCQGRRAHQNSSISSGAAIVSV
jgi:hypothetical protein